MSKNEELIAEAREWAESIAEPDRLRGEWFSLRLADALEAQDARIESLESRLIALLQPKSQAVRFLSKVKIAGSACWEWQGAKWSSGYGHFYWDAQDGQIPAHRAALRLFGIDMPDGLVPDHLCRNRACVNPDHLEMVTVLENNKRAAAVKAARETCGRGHLMTEENTIRQVRSDGSTYRRCRACTQETKNRIATCEICGAQLIANNFVRHLKNIHGLEPVPGGDSNAQ